VRGGDLLVLLKALKTSSAGASNCRVIRISVSDGTVMTAEP